MEAQTVTDVIYYTWQLFWRRDSESACILAIALTGWLDRSDLRILADYFKACVEAWDQRHGQ
jgi:hypothetical protein